MSSTHSEPGRMDQAPLLSQALSGNWWMILLRGLAAIAFGVLAFAWPAKTLLALTFLWGAYAITDGAFALWAAVTGKGAAAPRWWLAIVGIAGVVAGALTFAWPGLTAFVLLVMIATWAIVIGAMQVIGAIRLRKEIRDEWLLILSGLLSIGFGVLMFSQPLAGVAVMLWLIGVFAIVSGLTYVALALRLRKVKKAA